MTQLKRNDSAGLLERTWNADSPTKTQQCSAALIATLARRKKNRKIANSHKA